MKKLMRFILLVACLFVLQVKSQPNCDQYLRDFIPKSTDSVLTINVNFVIVLPTVGVTVWTGNAAARADQCIRVMDSIYAHIPVPQQTLSGVSNISHTKIRFVRSGLSYVANDNAYNNLFTQSLLTSYVDTNALNLFYGFGSFNHGTPFSPGHRALLFSSTTNDIGSHGSCYSAAHEVGHMLGLQHSSKTSYYSWDWQNDMTGDGVTTLTTTSGCCAVLTATDYVLEDTVIHRVCGHPLGSNNLMSQSIGCLQYLSPQQMAVIHYHLRTDMKRVLTSYSYDNHISRNSTADYSVTGADESFMNDRYFKGNITIKAGYKLTVYCQLAMAKGAKIKIEKGALMIVDGGTLTNISGQMWGGVEVQGDLTQA